MAKKHTIIAGTGRAGTTLLVRILTKMGIDTGFSQRDIEAAELNIGRAGLECSIEKARLEQLPTVIKSPNLINTLPKILEEKWFEIDRAIIPIRNLRDAAQSRIAVSKNAKLLGMDPFKAPGGLWNTQDPTKQRAALTETFYNTVEILALHNVPITFLHFPLFAQDPDYIVEKLGAYLNEKFNTTEEILLSAHASECKPGLIKTWTDTNNNSAV